MISRRFFLASALAGTASTAFAAAPLQSPRPLVRPDGIVVRSLPSALDLVERAGLGGRVGFVVANARTGQVLETYNPLLALPPASVAKAITTIYGLERLGPGFRFRTQIVAAGTLRNGRLEGDLWLVGGGDPVLDTDALNQMANAIRAAGLREVTGKLRIASGALPYVREISADQPDHVGYNPAIGGLNLNFNRVHFQWERTQDQYTLQMDARSGTIRPPVSGLRMRIAERDSPVYTFSERQGREEWTVARGALGESGSRWLPVRQPHLYAAEVFQVLARSNGIILDGPEVGQGPPAGSVVMVEQTSPPLEEILRDMMRWSTNITAEAVGLMASQAGGESPNTLSASARMMSRWMEDRLEARRPRFVDHSGLSDDSRVTANDMSHALVRAGADGLLRRLMKSIELRDDAGRPMPDHPISVVGKTGTLNFVSGLAGYTQAAGKRDLAFAVFCADVDRRRALRADQMEHPDGGRSYNTRAKRLQQALIERWVATYG
jgi:D-alanyl-D-alanine carboxypeptidase/D-alanyl-D-alanine-endopeptidase (penicillin-binding protein 4)